VTSFKTESEMTYRLIWKFSILSSLIGITVLYLSYHAIGGYGLVLLGVAHGVVFIPTLIADGCALWKIIIASIVCITYPFWGLMVGMMIFSVAAPLVDSFLWGLVVAWTLSRPWTILIFLLVGILSNISLFVVMHFNLGSSSDWGIPQTIGVWYVIMLPVFPLIIRYLPKPTTVPNPNECMHCSYSLVGLPDGSLCPECGRENSDLVKKF